MTKSSSKLPFLSVLGSFAIYFGTLLLLGPILYFWVLPQPGWVQVIVITIGALLLLLYIWCLPNGISRAVWGKLSWRLFGIGVLMWIVAFPISLLVGKGVELLFGPFDGDQVAVSQMKKTLEQPVLYVALAIAVAFIAPMVEEVIFRGFLQTYLRGYLRRYLAIPFSALVFAVFHFSPTQGLLNIQLLSVLWVLGLFLGYLYERTKSLAAPIGLHVAFNFFGVIGLIFDK